MANHSVNFLSNNDQNAIIALFLEIYSFDRKLATKEMQLLGFGTWSGLSQPSTAEFKALPWTPPPPFDRKVKLEDH